MTTPTHFILGSRPAPRREKRPRTDKESPNGLETLPRTILLPVSQIPRGENSTPADGTSTRVMTCMINKWRVKIDWKEVYNVRDPPRTRGGKKRARGEKKQKIVAVCMILKSSVT